MPDATESDWQPDFFSRMRMTAGQWEHGGQMGGMQDVDLRMFQHDNGHGYDHHDSSTNQQYLQGVGHTADSKWPADVNMDTPPVSGFTTGPSEGYFAVQARNSGHLHPSRPGTYDLATLSRPGSEHRAYRPQQLQVDVSETGDVDQRPGIERASTAPEPRVRRSTTSNLEPPALKRSGTSEDGEEDYVPCEDPKNRGRKRQRIPHTAVERRYRENLNAHLERLRLTVPTLAARGGEKQEGAKPSKSEVLSGAIEHIGALDKENQALKGEMKLMKGRLEELERWYRRGDRRTGFGA